MLFIDILIWIIMNLFKNYNVGIWNTIYDSIYHSFLRHDTSEFIEV